MIWLNLSLALHLNLEASLDLACSLTSCYLLAGPSKNHNALCPSATIERSTSVPSCSGRHTVTVTEKTSKSENSRCLGSSSLLGSSWTVKWGYARAAASSEVCRLSSPMATCYFCRSASEGVCVRLLCDLWRAILMTFPTRVSTHIGYVRRLDREWVPNYCCCCGCWCINCSWRRRCRSSSFGKSCVPASPESPETIQRPSPKLTTMSMRYLHSRPGHTSKMLAI